MECWLARWRVGSLEDSLPEAALAPSAASAHSEDTVGDFASTCDPRGNKAGVQAAIALA